MITTMIDVHQSMSVVKYVLKVVVGYLAPGIGCYAIKIVAAKYKIDDLIVLIELQCSNLSKNI
jgi:hypothetical protein